MRYLSICSGIEAATVAWHPLGWEAVAFAEVEKFPCAVLAHHYPEVPNWGDITRFKDWPDADVDVLVGGTPCQSFSVAGLRKGLADPRGNLALTYLAIADRYRHRWLVWENVPGVRSSDAGRAFGAFLGGLGELGYGWAYRSLDAQYFGLAQRRERVFVVGHLGDWRRAAAVLFEPESLRWDSPPRREAGQATPAGTLSSSHGNIRGDEAWTNRLVSHSLNAKGGSGRIDGESETFVTHALRADGFDASEDGTGRGTPLVYGLSQESDGSTARNAIDLARPITNSHANAGVMPAVAFSITPSNSNKDFNARANDYAQAVTTGGNVPSARGGDIVLAPMSVRRLTPVECERLQGFPDDYTLVPYRNKPAMDGPRYKALGNSMAVPCMRWIGEQIEMVQSATPVSVRDARAAPATKASDGPGAGPDLSNG